MDPHAIMTASDRRGGVSGRVVALLVVAAMAVLGAVFYLLASSARL
jgi:hypothetical protein